MSKKKETVLARVPKRMYWELKNNYPNRKFPELIQSTYDFSLVKQNIILKDKDFKNKMGRFIYGKAWPNDTKRKKKRI